METVDLDDTHANASRTSANGEPLTYSSFPTSAGGGDREVALPAYEPDVWANTNGTTSSSSSSSTTTGGDLVNSLPPLLPIAMNTIAIGSPLMSFSPVASVAAVFDAPSEGTSISTTTTTTTTSTTTVAAVDDLLSFSPVSSPSSFLGTTSAAPSLSSSSSSLLMMDDFFCSPASTSVGSSSSSNLQAPEAATTSLLLFPPVESTSTDVPPPPAPFSNSFLTDDLVGLAQESSTSFAEVQEQQELSSPLVKQQPSQLGVECDSAQDVANDGRGVDAVEHPVVMVEQADEEEEEKQQAAMQRSMVQRPFSPVPIDADYSEDKLVAGGVDETESATPVVAHAQDDGNLEGFCSTDISSANQFSLPVGEGNMESGGIGGGTLNDKEDDDESPRRDREEHTEPMGSETNDLPRHAAAQGHDGAGKVLEPIAMVGEEDDSTRMQLHDPIHMNVSSVHQGEYDYAGNGNAVDFSSSSPPGSAVSSPGSSVSGSAFAFISVGASSPISSQSATTVDHRSELFTSSPEANDQHKEAEPPAEDDREDFHESIDQSASSFSFDFEPHEAEESSFGGFSTNDTGVVDGIESTFGGAVSLSEVEKIGDNEEEDDDFGGFGQSTAGADGSDDDDTFGDFGAASAWGSSSDVAAASSRASMGFHDDDDDDDDFGDFTPAPAAQQWGDMASSSSTSAPSPVFTSSSWDTVATATTPPPEPTPVAASATPIDLHSFFSTAFPVSTVPVSSSVLPEPTSASSSSNAPMMTMAASSVFDQGNASILHKNFHSSLQVYRAVLAGELEESQQSQSQQPHFECEALRLKYLKYVLTEKLTEASRPDGVFPHGSESYHVLVSICESGNEKHMRQALAQLQDALFHSSVNEAVMRMARQAALSAKVRIAEQAAHQQAHARGSLLATTRHFLSRGSLSGTTTSTTVTAAAHGNGSTATEKDQHSASSSSSRSGSSGALPPAGGTMGAKKARGPPPPSTHSGGHESSGGGGDQSSGYGSGDDTGSEASVGDASSHSEGGSDFTSGAGGGSGPSSSTGRTGGGLMKKFQSRLTSFSSSSTKHRTHTVSLRRMGQSSEDVRKMELQMDSISGGFDQVKWRCAVFVYDTDEVAHLAPSQIKLFAYPSNQLLTGKSDRSVLTKFCKPGTIWSIDIGANSNSGVSME